VKVKGSSACECCEGTGKAFNAIDAEWAECLYCGGSGLKRGQSATTQPKTDAEAIVVDRAYRAALRKMVGPIDVMRAAINELDAHRRAQPTSGLADDARKIVEALHNISHVTVSDPWKLTARMMQEIAREATPLAEALAGKIEALEADNSRLRGVIERDRTKTAEVISTARGVVASRAWLAEGRGSYAFDDEMYQSEFGAAVTEMLAALDPLRALAADWSDCPKDFQDARIDWKSRAEAAESQLAAVTKERDEARAYAFEATKTITGLTVGGSEFFAGKLGDKYKADLPFCESHIRDRFMHYHEMTIAAMRGKKAAEAQLAERAAEVARLREAFNKAEQRLNESGTGEMGLIDTIHAVYAIIRAALAPTREKTPPDEPTDHEAMGAMIYRGKQEARNGGGDDE
jgi:hypothetical protein